LQTCFICARYLHNIIVFFLFIDQLSRLLSLIKIALISKNIVFCNTDDNCTWMTYLPDISFCELQTNCSSLDTQLCDNCLSAQHDCIPNEKVCSIQGSCNGIKMHSEEMQTAKDCLQLCDATPGCRWFTFYTLVPVCVLFENCPSIDESCEDCISGERRCIDEVVSSTTEITSTATETTSTTTTTTSTTTKMLSTSSVSPQGNCKFC
jgi:hypothetical protein